MGVRERRQRLEEGRKLRGSGGEGKRVKMSKEKQKEGAFSGTEDEVADVRPTDRVDREMGLVG